MTHFHLDFIFFAGVNTVLKSLCLQSGEEILVYTYTYSAIRKAVDSAADKDSEDFSLNLLRQ